MDRVTAYCQLAQDWNQEMTARLTLTAVAVAAMAIITISDAKAIPVGTFYNTGVDDTQTTLANLAPETHYTLVSTPDGSTPGVRVATSANGFPIPPWLDDNSLSAWIGPNTNSSLDGAAGLYDYRTTFDLTGFDASTAALSGQWAADNAGIDILINGVSTSQTVGGFDAFSSLSISTGFVNGLNKIDFIVRNDGGPTGLRVEGLLTADAVVSDVPEPMSLAILGVGLAGAGLVRRFNRI